MKKNEKVRNLNKTIIFDESNLIYYATDTFT